MNCLQFRQDLLADPYHLDDEALAHRDDCPACRAFAADIERLDRSIAREFEVAVPEGLAARVLLNQSLKNYPRTPKRWYWLSMAASFFLVLAVGFTLLRTAPLEAGILSHMDHEQHEVHWATGNLTPAVVDGVLQAVAGSLAGDPGIVTYASPCIIDGQVVAHLVVIHEGQAYTVLLSPRTVYTRSAFGNERWVGQVMPHPHGSLAVVRARTQPGANLDLASQHFVQVIATR